MTWEPPFRFLSLHRLEVFHVLLSQVQAPIRTESLLHARSDIQPPNRENKLALPSRAHAVDLGKGPQLEHRMSQRAFEDSGSR